ncbi:MAG: hypothetical protein SXG53_04240 [Pseudomonadota bacterium]|nr:hypothetical protein [Pseudomonadota bacterium]
MRSIWIGITFMNLVAGTATAQDAASAAGPPQTPVVTTPSQQAASSASLPAITVDQALRKDIATILATTLKIAKEQENEGSLLLKVRDGFVTSALWELFGFKSTEKTLVGYVISCVGILGLLLKAVWFVSKRGEPEPRWARILTYMYLLAVVSIFTLLASSGGVVSEVPASSSAAKPLLEASARLEAAADKLLRARAANSETAVTPTPPSHQVEGQQAANADALAALREELTAVSIFSQKAAEKSAEAAGRSTGWVWHLLMVLLLGSILLLQAAVYEQTKG